MKKIIVALSLVLLPSTAHAQSGGDQVIQAAADELKPAFCANDLKQAIQIVEGCYAKVDEDSEKYNMNQCVIEDLAVVVTIKKKQQQYINNYQTDPYSSLDFIQTKSIAMRASKHPNFMSNLVESNDVKNAGLTAVIKTVKILMKENCLDLDKLQ
ncbi:hypothetical protein [Commensalibacter oyaizuii]|uniref:DUF1311 domain-containing protein n=1 Tax=Commensalibacter oyaizuii TaxID=3043873 RepID=A0ABT6Q3Y9_9PROT|nr:hypothetical protein [Commensalibacter sp. TBRC 16381]MDI2091823.1 hypothetical protein [Commensalibacter sp. TBRC 16381]